MITNRNNEFIGTITAIYNEELGRGPEPTGLASWLDACQRGMTGEKLRQLIHDSPEAVNYRNRPAPVVPKTPRIHVEGLGFVDENGTPWRMAFVSSFRLYQRFLAGEDITPILQETVDVGANGVRVFGAFDFGAPQVLRLYPNEHVDYYGRLPEFYALVASYGLYVQFTAFADTGRSVPGVQAQFDHWNNVCQNTFNSPNVLLERVNENNQHENRVNSLLPRPNGICSSFGSNGAGNNPPGPYWDYSDLHPERPVEMPKLLQSTSTLAFAIYGTGGGFDGTRIATVASEPIGFAETDIPGKRVASPEVAYILGLGCQWGAGGTAHSDCGVGSVLLTPTQKACVTAFIKGVKA